MVESKSVKAMSESKKAERICTSEFQVSSYSVVRCQLPEGHKGEHSFSIDWLEEEQEPQAEKA